MGKFLNPTALDSTTIRVFLDTRRLKKSGRFPVKLRIYCKAIGERFDFPIGLDLTEEEFELSWMNPNPKGRMKDIQLSMRQTELRANDLISSMVRFDPNSFKVRFLGYSAGRLTVEALYNEAVQECNEENRCRTGSSYELSYASLKAYNQDRDIYFTSITPKWLKGYERYMVENGKSLTTVGFYLRPLRAIYNKAIAEGMISRDYYPFGTRLYQIPKPRAKKRSLTLNQIRSLYSCEVENEFQELARDYWFFSYFCNGINFADMVQLTDANISDGFIQWYRQKTMTTNKSQDVIRASIGPELTELLVKFSKVQGKSWKYLLPILETFDDAKEKVRKTNNLVRFVNQHMARVSEIAGLPFHVSTYYARHSFVTIAVNAGVSVAHVSRALGHSSIETTKSYIGSLELKDEHALAAIISAAVTNEEVA